MPRRFYSCDSAVRIALIKDDLYLVHGAKNVAEVFKTSSLSVTLAYGIALRYCFGMARKATSVYFADTTGPQQKPIQGTTAKPQNRVYYRTHENLLRGLLGTGLAPVSDRFESALTESLSSLHITEEGVIFPDFLEFFEDFLGTAIIKSIFGSALLSQSPDFVSNMWKFDKLVMNLAKQLPRVCIPESYRLRTKLLQSIKRWHAFARTHSVEKKELLNEDADVLWGSETIKDRYKMLLDFENQDYDSVASTDLGFIWA